MAIMALISVAFFLGVNFVDAEANPRVALWFWIALLSMLVWLCVLALIDLSELRRLRNRLREAARQILADEKQLRESLHNSDHTDQRTR
jgi:threonine/homoserine/homoserine lactone efflux protein